MLVAALAPGAASAARRPPASFFGIAPQTPVTEADAAYMSAGGIGTVRLPLYWPVVQPTAEGPIDWSGFDEQVAAVTRAGLRVLPYVYGTPDWLARRQTTLPIEGSSQRAAWMTFLEAAVRRYGPNGEFWLEHAHEGINYEPAIPKPIPIREWQIWNEANFFYFATPVSPLRYGQLLALSSEAIKSVDPHAKIILSGLFGQPSARGSRGMLATTFLNALYRVPGIKSDFDGVALHPYAVDTLALEHFVEAFHQVTVRHHDRVGLYITEMGWGSQNDFRKVAYEQGIGGQVRELRGAYRYLIAKRARLDLQQVDWFSWKDRPGSCNFCDSAGLFRAGTGFSPKPAWRAFIALSGGRPGPW